MGEMHEKPAHVPILEKWMKSYKPHELFDANGKLKSEIADLSPKGERRMSANPHANGGLLLKDLRMPEGSLVALIRRRGETLVPRGSTVLHEWDRLTIIGEPLGLKELAERYQSY